MKKLLLTLFAAASLTASAQYQLENAGFEEWETVTYGKKSGEEPVNWNSFLDGEGKLKGTAAAVQVAKSTDTRPGSTGSASAKITARNVLTVIAQGNLTTGCVNMGSMSPTDANGNYNYTDEERRNQKFSGLPDAMHVWVKFKGTNGKATTILHTKGYYQDPYGNNSKITATKIAEAANTTIASNDEAWQELTIPFTYDVTDGTRPYYALVSFATNATAGKGAKSDYMCIDDLEYLYYHALSDLKYDGTTVADFSETTLTYDLSTTTYDASKLSYTKKGQGATVETSYDDATALLTITVKGDNYEADNTSKTTYTVQFKTSAAPAATLTAATVGGIDVSTFTKTDDTHYTATLPIAYNAGIVADGTPAEGSTLLTNSTYTNEEEGYVEYGFYDNDKKTITLQVANADNVVTYYTFSFTDAVTTGDEVIGTYSGALSVVLGTGEGEDAVETVCPLSNANIQLSKNSNGTYNIALPNFSFAMMSMLVGDIYVPNLTLNGNTLSCKGTVIRLASDSEEAIGYMLGHLPVNITLTIDDRTKKYADASIDIVTTESSVGMVQMFSKIHVDYVPFSVDEDAESNETEDGTYAYANQTLTGYVSKASTAFLHLNEQLAGVPMYYLDLSNVTLAADVTADDLKQGAVADNNTVYYLAESATLKGTNLVNGTTAEAFAFNDKAPFHFPKAFTATTLTYNRTFEEGKLATFVLPVSIEASKVNGKVYKLTGFTSTAFEFEQVTGTLEANTPYVVEMSGTTLFNGGGTLAAANSETKTENALSGISHFGNYGETQTLTSDATKTYYGYQGGQFVKAKKGTLNRYRTAFAIDGASGVAAFQFGNTTGIHSATTDAQTDATTYDLQGRRVNHVAAKGVFIVNGKKVIK